MEGRKAVALAGTWKPFRNTEIRATADRERAARAVLPSTFNDSVSGWDGTSTYSTRIATGNNALGVSVQPLRTVIFTPSGGNQLVNYQGWAATLGLHLPLRFATAHRSAGFCGGGSELLYDLHLGVEEDVSFPQALEAGRAVALAIQVTAELGDDDRGFTQGELFF